MNVYICFYGNRRMVLRADSPRIAKVKAIGILRGMGINGLWSKVTVVESHVNRPEVVAVA